MNIKKVLVFLMVSSGFTFIADFYITIRNKTLEAKTFPILKRRSHMEANTTNRYQETRANEILTKSDQKKRISHLRKFCQGKLNKSNFKRPIKNLFYSDKKRIIYCSVPKVACTSWKKIFLYFNGNVKNPFKSIDSAHKLLTSRLNKNQQDYNQRLTTYYSFLFVRNPFDRLLSAYRNKFYDVDREQFRRKYLLFTK